MIRGDRIKRLREERGLDQAMLAKRANVHYSYVYRLENNETPNVSAVILARIAKVLDTTVEYLIGDVEDVGRAFGNDRPRLTVETEELALRLDALDGTTKSVLTPMLQDLVGAAERSTSDARKRLVQEYDSLSPEQQKVLLQAAEALAREREQEGKASTSPRAQG